VSTDVRWTVASLPFKPRWKIPLDFGEVTRPPPGRPPQGRPLDDREARALLREPRPVMPLWEQALRARALEGR
jgi:hypothetical protein